MHETKIRLQLPKIGNHMDYAYHDRNGECKPVILKSE